MRRQLEDDDDWDEGCDLTAATATMADRATGDDDGDEDDSTVPCPYCGQQMYEDSPRCPHCGQYISEEDAPPSRARWWIILGVLLCLCVVLVWIIAF